MTIATALAVSLVFATAQAPPVPPPPPAVRLTAAEDAVLRPLVTQWSVKRPFASSPLVVTTEGFPYRPEYEPALRLELLRHGVDAVATEALLASMRARNAQPASIEAAALAGTTRIRFIDILLKGMDRRTADDPSLRNLGGVVMLAVPGTSGDLGAVFYNVGPQITNTPYKYARFAFVRGGRVEWDETFGKYPALPKSPLPPKFATLNADGVAVVRALLDRHYTDGTKRVLLVNETGDALFLPRPELGRAIEMVPRERLNFVPFGLGDAAGAIMITLPSINGETATIGYRELVHTGAGLTLRSGTATLKRGGGAWSVVDDKSAMEATTVIDPNVPYRVGGDVKAPRIVKRVRPQFPEGTRLVIVEFIVGTDGKIKDVRFLIGASDEVQRVAREALSQWELEPGTLNGKPVPVLWNATLP